MAQDPPAVQTSPDQSERFGNVSGLPRWLRLGFELRGRIEANLDREQDLDERFYLNRLRVGATVQPAAWARFHFQGQDARVLGLGAGSDFAGYRNTFEVRQGYFELGHPEQDWQLRFGRQELALGDERLIGADGYWDRFGLAFDAVRLSWVRNNVRFDTFTGFVVTPARRRPDPFDTGSRISGISVQLPTKGGGVLEPYLFWKRGGDTWNLLGDPGHRDVATPGLRAQGSIPGRLDYNIEMALQRGHLAGDAISAWAGHWDLGWKPLGQEVGPRLSLAYNYASGDADPGDGRHQTFDDMYPAGFNKFGTPDPIAWRNISYPAAEVEVPITRRWTLYGGTRFYWLANARDGLYPGGDEYVVRNPDAASSRVGSQLVFAVAYQHSPRWRVGAGYDKFFAGPYLRQSSLPLALRTVFVQSSYAF
jgi:hypothetical protein